MKIRKLLPLAALSVGPFAAYLVWAVQTRRWYHAAFASALNIALWTGGPYVLAKLAGIA